MNDDNNFSFMNNEQPNTNPEPQPVSQDNIFSGAPTPEPTPAPVETMGVEPQTTTPSYNQTPDVPVQPVQPVNTYVEPTPVSPVTNEEVPTNNFNEQYNEPQSSYEPVNNSDKKKLNPKILIIAIAAIILIVAGVILLKGCNNGYGKKSSKYPNKFNNAMYYKVSDNEIYEIKYYEDSKSFAAKDSYKKYFDRRIYYPDEYKNVGYFDIDLKFVNEDSLTTQCAKDGRCSNAYEDYNDDLVYKNTYTSNTDEGINTKKINGREYKYFIGKIIKSSDNTYYYVVYQTKITDNVYYVVSYFGGVELTEERLQGFLNIKTNKLSSENDIKNKDGLEWY